MACLKRLFILFLFSTIACAQYIPVYAKLTDGTGNGAFYFALRFLVGSGTLASSRIESGRKLVFQIVTCPRLLSVSFFSTFRITLSPVSSHDPFVWPECATKGYAGADHRCITPPFYGYD
jgi:hypothetical protein